MPYHKLHVAGSRSLRSGSRNLLRQVGRRHDHFGEGDTVVLKEDHLQLVAHVLVGVDLRADVVDSLIICLAM